MPYFFFFFWQFLKFIHSKLFNIFWWHFWVFLFQFLFVFLKPGRKAGFYRGTKSKQAKENLTDIFRFSFQNWSNWKTSFLCLCIFMSKNKLNSALFFSTIEHCQILTFIFYIYLKMKVKKSKKLIIMTLYAYDPSIILWKLLHTHTEICIDFTEEKHFFNKNILPFFHVHRNATPYEANWK